MSLVDLWRSLSPRAAREIAAILIGVFLAGVAAGRWLVPPVHEQAVTAQRAQQRETAIGVSDGVNRTFTLNRTPPDPAQVKIWLGGLLLDRDRTTISGRTLTFRANTIPLKDESVEVEYYARATASLMLLPGTCTAIATLASLSAVVSLRCARNRCRPIASSLHVLS